MMMADQHDAAISITYLELFNEWLNVKSLTRDKCCDKLLQYVYKENVYSSYNRKIIMNLIKNIEKRWKICSRNKTTFRLKNQTWLESQVVFHEDESEINQPGPSRIGRPSKNFNQCGIRSKQKKVQGLTSTASAEELAFATQMSLRKSGKRNAAAIIESVTNPNSPKRAKKYKKAYNLIESKKLKPTPLRAEEALALIINTKSCKATYLAYRMVAQHCNANIYPSWNKILSAKCACYPELQSSIRTKDTRVEIKLQDLLNLTAKRLCQLQAEVLNLIAGSNLNLLCKWGLDGTSGQSNYRQLNNTGQGDSSVIIISLVPLQLRDCNDETKIVWQNPVPSSTRFCRVIKFVFAKETPELIVKETKQIQKQISKLSNLFYENKSISFTLILSMVDGKVCHSLTDTRSTQSCYICQARPKEMNNLNSIHKKLAKIEHYNFGLSTLHSWIRFFECCLHIGYRMEIKSWQARGENRTEMELRKEQIIERLRKELGILVDKPKPGYGSTNTGNTARIFFRNYQKSAEITGVDEDLIRRFYIILQTISSGYEVDSQKFKIYTMDTAKTFVSLYPWFYMPTSVHKVLIHGADIVKHAIVPIGQLGEEAQEAKNKDFKFIREHRSRKDSAKHTNMDLFNYFLLSSDPIISSLALQNKCNKNKLKLDPESLNLLKYPPVAADADSDSSDTDSQ